MLLLADPPEVACQSDQVGGGGGVTVSLGCFVHGEPSPSVNWFRSDLRNGGNLEQTWPQISDHYRPHNQIISLAENIYLQFNFLNQNKSTFLLRNASLMENFIRLISSKQVLITLCIFSPAEVGIFFNPTNSFNEN